MSKHELRSQVVERSAVFRSKYGFTKPAYKVVELAAVTGVPAETLYALVRRGVLPKIRTGKRAYVVATLDVERWFDEQRERAEFEVMMLGEGGHA